MYSYIDQIDSICSKICNTLDRGYIDALCSDLYDVLKKLMNSQIQLEEQEIELIKNSMKKAVQYLLKVKIIGNIDIGVPTISKLFIFPRPQKRRYLILLFSKLEIVIIIYFGLVPLKDTVI